MIESINMTACIVLCGQYYYLALNKYKSFNRIILVSFKIVLMHVIFEVNNKY